MKFFLKIIIFTLLNFSNTLFSQSKAVSLTLPTVALLDVEPPGVNINLNFASPAEAGNPIAVPTPNNSKWLNYTSAISASGTARTVTASVSQTIPGILIRLSVANATGSGAGVLGVSSAQTAITLTTTPTTVITGIRGAYTGNGTGNGHQLTVSAVTGNYTNITASTTSVSVTYTISD